MKPSTSPLPSTAQAQKPAEGRCRYQSAPSKAVDSGSSAVTTAPWVLGTWRSASARNSGKPTITPNAVMPSSGHSARTGRFRRP